MRCGIKTYIYLHQKIGKQRMYVYTTGSRVGCAVIIIYYFFEIIIILLLLRCASVFYVLFRISKNRK